MGLAPPLTRLQPLGHSVALWRESAVVPSLTKASRERIQAGGTSPRRGNRLFADVQPMPIKADLWIISLWPRYPLIRVNQYRRLENLKRFHPLKVFAFSGCEKHTRILADQHPRI